MSADLFQLGRRSLLKGTAGALALTVVGPLQALYSRQAMAAGSLAPVASPYGPIFPTRDLTTGLPLLKLPKGFTYKSFGWTGDLMTNGQPCPSSHDGMAVVRTLRVGRGTEMVLIRNHEKGFDTLIDASAQYDTNIITVTDASGAVVDSGTLGGGTTNLIFRNGDWVSVAPSIGGTAVNCAGGVTPWGTWLTCEEFPRDFTSFGGKKHGYVFEVRADAGQTTGSPIVDMGRFSHEAVGVDPKTNAVYLTEDDRNKSALYRFLPNNTSSQAGAVEQGGKLQAAKVAGQNNVDLLTPSQGDEYQLEWVDLPEPDADRGPFDAVGASMSEASGPFLQAWERGALRMARGEGIWHFAGKMFIVDTAAGVDSQGRPGRGEGAVWQLDLTTMRLKAIFVSSAEVAANNPDNITVSPRGGILLCEDGGGADDQFGFGDRLMGLTGAGESYIFAKNNVVLEAADISRASKQVEAADYRGNEFAGACFDPTGRVLFVNIQTPGITFAISGPWARGPL